MNTKENLYQESLYIKPYMFLKGYATGKKLTYTLMALPLAKEAHSDQFRKTTVIIDGQPYRLPYLTHCLKVACTLVSLNLPMTDVDEDLLLASALLHDVLEDCDMGIGGKKLLEYGFPEELLTIITTLTKRSGYNEAELDQYFTLIKQNAFCTLIKLADRSHNVEDLYNMSSPEKLHKYIYETKRWLYDMADYGKCHYPQFVNAFFILKGKITSLTEESEAIINIYEKKLSTYSSKDSEE